MQLKVDTYIFLWFWRIWRFREATKKHPVRLYDKGRDLIEKNMKKHKTSLFASNHTKASPVWWALIPCLVQSLPIIASPGAERMVLAETNFPLQPQKLGWLRCPGRLIGLNQGWAPRPAKKGLPRPAPPRKKASLAPPRPAPRKLAKPAGRGGAKFIWIPWKLDRSQFQFDSYVSKKSLQCIASTNVL